MIKSKLSTFIGTLILAGIVATGGIFINVRDNTNISKITAEVKKEDYKDKAEETKVETANQAKQEEAKDEETKNEENKEEEVKPEEAKNEENNSNGDNIEKENTQEYNNTNKDNEVAVLAPKDSDTQEESNNNAKKLPISENVIQKPVEQQKENNIVYDSNNYISEIEQGIFQRVNAERLAAGLPALSYNTTMEYYARMKSKYMGDNEHFDHMDKEGRLMNKIIQADGISYRAWGENIAYIQGLNDYNALSNRFMNNWMNSEGHKANILSSKFTSIGIGVYKIGDIYYATQEFYN